MKQQTKFATLADLLRRRADGQPERVAYRFWTDEGEELSLTYRDLEARARALAVRLHRQGAEGQRALLLYPPGMEYVIAFFGCLLAGVMAVPAYPPRKNGHLGRLQAVALNAQASFALTTSAVWAGVQSRFAETPGLERLDWVVTDGEAWESDAESLVEQDKLWEPPLLTEETLAFLQYTSGSTSTPKGVMLTHGNLIHNLGLIEEAFGTSPESRGVVWLPPYHDMGLIGGILQPLYTGYPMTLMSPVSFIQRPLRWLEAISRTGATVSGGPNFAYELCVQKITPEQRDGLDLSTWTNAFTGAEPIRAETLERFAAYFAPCGFRKEAFYPCYGLAEGTLFVTGGIPGAEPVVRRFDGEGLSKDLATEVEAGFEKPVQTLVSSGVVSRSGQVVLVVDPERREICEEGTVGEIWVAGPSVAQGYWQRPELTEETFGARLAAGAEVGAGVADDGILFGDGSALSQRTFLRTGDLGFWQKGELFVTGRRKDLIIIRGRNFYPQDVEFAVSESHPAVAGTPGAAFSVDVDGEERLVVVQEVDRKHRKGNLEEAVAAIRQKVAEVHQLQTYAVVLIKPASIPKTSSGKIQRFKCRELFLEAALEVVRSSVLDAAEDVSPDGLGGDAEDRTLNSQETAGVVFDWDTVRKLGEEEKRQAVETLLLHQASKALRVPPSRIDAEQSLNALGLDSMMAVELAHEIEERTGVVLSLNRLVEGPSLRELTEMIVAEGLTSEESAAVAERQTVAEQSVSVDQEAVPLSHGQRALWFLQRLAPDSAAYNISRALRLSGDVEPSVLREAFERLARRHPVLRTAFFLEKGEPVQKLKAQGAFSYEVVSTAGWAQGELEKRLTEEANRPFDLEKGPLWRVHLFEGGAPGQEAVLLIAMHHILVDFWSFGVLVRELGEMYSALRGGGEGQAVQADAAVMQAAEWKYASHVLEQSALLNGPEGERLLQYWQEQLAGRETVLHLPTDRPRPPMQTYNGAAKRFVLPDGLSQRLKALAKERGVTLYMVLLAAYQVLLHRYTGQAEIFVGSPTAGRNRAKYAETVGYFVNPVVIRTDFAEPLTFETLLAQVRATVLAAMEHQAYPFSLLVEKVQPNRDMSYPPLFQTMFALHRAAGEGQEALGALSHGVEGVKVRAGDLEMESVPVEQRFSQVDLTLTMAEHEGTLSGTVEFNTDLFDDTTVERMLGHFVRLLEGAAARPEWRVAELPLLTEAERHQVVVGWNDTASSYPQDLCIHQAVEEQAARTPDVTALVDEAGSLTYRELNARANRLAIALRELGVGPDAAVGIWMDRAKEFVLSALAVMKAGGAYVPLDVTMPQERLAFILRDAKVAVLLKQAEAELPDADVPVLSVERSAAVDPLTEHDAPNPPCLTTPDNTAYLIYTSGTTGQPKGVAVPHRGVMNLAADLELRSSTREGEAYGTVGNFGFDASVTELFPPLMAGGTLHVAPEEVRYQAELLGAWLAERKIRGAYIPAFLLQDLTAWLRQGNSLHLHRLLVGAEPISEPLLAELAECVPGLTILNGYGPSEATVYATVYEVQGPVTGTPPKRNAPLGKPIRNVEVYVLDEQLQPVPVGVPGEVHIGGAGVAVGYLNRPELTAEKFIPHPFRGADTGARVYKTGDLARWMPDGNLEFLGRRDTQVKVRGYRIELGEIEKQLLAHDAVKEAVVIVREDSPGDKRLAAYVVSGEGGAPTGAELRLFLQDRLPAYMIPSAFLTLDALPVTANGKIDHRALPKPEPVRSEAAYVAPSNETERKITAIWQEVLGVEQVGIHDNFFDLGGHSLALSKAHSRVQEDLQRTFPIVEMFRHTTVAELTQFLTREQKQGPTAQELREQADKKRDAINRRKQLMQNRRR